MSASHPPPTHYYVISPPYIMANLQLTEHIKNKDIIDFEEPEGFKGELKPSQKKAVLWMYTVNSGLLADCCGAGKTIDIIAYLLLLRKKGMLRRAIIIVPSESISQWTNRIKEFSDLDFTVTSRRPKKERRQIYAMRDWNILLMNYALFIRDAEILNRLDFNICVADECTYYKNRETKTAQMMKEFCSNINRVIGMSATPIHKSLVDIFSIFESINPIVLGNYRHFSYRHIKRAQKPIWIKRGGRRKKIFISEIVGYQNLGEVKQKLRPYCLHRTIDDIECEMPKAVFHPKFIELGKEQKIVYNKLREKSITLLREGKMREVRSSSHSIQKSLDGLSCLDSQFKDYSVKLDKIMEYLTGSLSNDKVVIYSRYKSTIDVLSNRFKKANIDYIVISGDVDRKVRDEGKDRFMRDSKCQVCLGTSALGMSIDLQAARYLILIDPIGNPATVEQLVGRIRRIGSKYKTVIAIQLLTVKTTEHRLYNLLQERQALSTYFWDKDSDLFNRLSRDQLLDILEGEEHV